RPIDRDVHHDPVNPSIERGLAPKAFDRFPRFHKAVLGQVPSVLLAMDHVVNHTEYPCAVAGYQLVECFGVTGLASSYQVQFRYIGLSQSRFRLHDWTESTLFHSTPKAFGAKTAAPLAAILTHESDNAIANLKEPLLQHRVLGRSNQLRRLR